MTKFGHPASKHWLREYMTAGIFMRRNLILSSEHYVIFYEIWTVCWRARKNMKLAHNDSRPFFRDVFTWPPGFKSWIFESGIELPFVKIGTHSLSSQGCVIFTCASVWLADVPGLGNVSFISFRRFCLSLVQSTWIASQQQGPEGFCRSDEFVYKWNSAPLIGLAVKMFASRSIQIFRKFVFRISPDQISSFLTEEVRDEKFWDNFTKRERWRFISVGKMLMESARSRDLSKVRRLPANGGWG